MAQASPSSNALMSVDQFLTDGTFTPISREEYIATKAERAGITYAEAEQLTDANISAAIDALPTNPGPSTNLGPRDSGIRPATWQGDYTVTNPGGTFAIYGRVYAIYTHASGLKAIYEVQAVALASHYGKNWAECSPAGTARPYGSGAFTFDGNCTANLVSTTQLRMTISGYFSIEQNIAISSGVNLKFFNYSATVGNTKYYRDHIYGTHIETIFRIPPRTVSK